MNLRVLPYNLEFRKPFKISHGTRTFTPALFLQLNWKEFTGYGEITLPPYLKENRDTVLEFLRQLAPLQAPSDWGSFQNLILSLPAKNKPALAGLDMALHDLAGKILDKKTFEFYGLPPVEPKPTMVTIASDNPKLVDSWLEEHRLARQIKVKLGSENDLELISYLRKKTSLNFGIDANGGWNNVPKIEEMIREIANFQPMFIEQPCPPDSDQVIGQLKQKKSIPLIADESFQTMETIKEVLNNYHGVNIKLMKCGGIRSAVEILNICKNRKAAVLLGCMSESSCGISAAAQISAMVDWVDLDGPILIKNDPFEGLLENYNLKKQELPGNGITLKNDIFSSAEAIDIF